MMFIFLSFAAEKMFFSEWPAWVWLMNAAICAVLVICINLPVKERRQWSAAHGELLGLLSIYKDRTVVLGVFYTLLIWFIGWLILF